VVVVVAVVVVVVIRPRVRRTVRSARNKYYRQCKFGSIGVNTVANNSGCRGT
jgi:hypothetical protein